MWFFRTINASHLGAELDALHAHLSDPIGHGSKDAKHEALMALIATEFEALFTQGDGVAFDLSAIASVDVDAILVDLLMFEDDEIFRHALHLLMRQYGQRAKLLEAVSGVCLLSHGALPIIESASRLQADLGMLRYALRSTEVWAVKSRMSGDFNRQTLDFVRTTLTNLRGLLEGDGEPMDDYFDNPMHEAKGPSPPLRSKSESAESSTDFHELLRKMDLQRTLFDALGSIDYNIAFQGSICEDHDKLTSRSMLIDVLRLILTVLRAFCKGSAENQALTATQLDFLMALTGPLKLPDVPIELQAQAERTTSSDGDLGAEEVIMEIFQDNTALCAKTALIKRSMADHFGDLIERTHEDVSLSRHLRFFKVICGEGTIRPNQMLAVETLFARNAKAERTPSTARLWRRPKLVSAVVSLLGSNPDEIDEPEAPGVLLDLMANVVHDNLESATVLLSLDVTIETVFSRCAHYLDNILSVYDDDQPDELLSVSLDMADDPDSDVSCLSSILRILRSMLSTLAVHAVVFDSDHVWTSLGACAARARRRRVPSSSSHHPRLSCLRLFLPTDHPSTPFQTASRGSSAISLEMISYGKALCTILSAML